MNKIIKNFFYNFFGNIFSRFFVFIMFVYIARIFGPKQFGVINFTSTIITYFSMLSYLGLQTLGTLKVSHNRNNIKNYVDEIVSLRVILSVITFILVILLTLIIDKDFETKVMILLTGISLIASSISLDWMFNGIQDMKYTSYATIISNLLSFFIILVCVSTKIVTNIYIVPIANFISIFISNIYLISIYRKKTQNKFNYTFSSEKFKNLIISAWPFFFSGIFATINCNIDTLMLGIMRTPEEVGLYNAVYRIINALLAFTGIIFTPIYPVLAQYYVEEKYGLLSEIINKVRRIILIISIPIILTSFFISKDIILYVYGYKYIDSYFALTILCIYVGLLYVREIYGYELSAWNQQKNYMKVVLISSTFNIVSNLIFIPKYGINGAAINTLISEIINIIFMSYFSKKTLKIEYVNNYIINIVFSSIIMVIFIYFTKMIIPNVIMRLTIGSLIYVLLIFLLKVISLSEIKKLKVRRA